MKYHAVFVFLPFTQTSHLFNAMPMAPALLKGICDSHGLKTTTIDLNIELQTIWEKDNHHTQIQKYLMYWNQMTPEAYDWYHKWVEKEAIRLIELQTNWIGLSLLSYQSLTCAQDLCFYIKKHNPEQKIILGGPGISQDDNTRRKYKNDKVISEVMIETGLCDTIIINESETLLVDVLINNKKGKFNSNKQLTHEELSQLPTPSYIDYKVELYKNPNEVFYKDERTAAATITGSKGCVRKCTFCDVFTFEPKFVFKDGNKIADEMIEIYEKQGINNFHFSDSLINGSMKAFRQMNEALAKRLPRTLSYFGEYIARPKNQVTDEDYALMKEAGCAHVIVGVESGSEAVRNHMKKKFTNDDLHTMIEKLHGVGITQEWNLMVGYITETRKDFEETLALVEKYKHIPYPNMIVNPVGVLHLLPGTALTDVHARKLDVEWEDVKEGVGMVGDYWKTSHNPENTFDARIQWWIELLTMCNEYGYLTSNRYKNKRDLANRMLEHWKQSKK